MTPKIQHLALAIMTMVVVAIVVIMGQTGPDCTTPSTWATESGVRHCAINGGK